MKSLYLTNFCFWKSSWQLKIRHAAQKAKNPKISQIAYTCLATRVLYGFLPCGSFDAFSDMRSVVAFLTCWIRTISHIMDGTWLFLQCEYFHGCSDLRSVVACLTCLGITTICLIMNRDMSFSPVSVFLRMHVLTWDWWLLALLGLGWKPFFRIWNLPGPNVTRLLKTEASWKTPEKDICLHY